MVLLVSEFLQLLEQYFVYVYPGFISIVVYNFTNARQIKMSRKMIGVDIIISYIYLLIYKTILKTTVENFANKDYIILLFVAVIVPLIWYWFSKSLIFEKILVKLDLNTTLDDTAWDYIQSRDKEKQGIVLKVFVDDKKFMYEGSLRYRESDPNKIQTICLSGYRRYVYENNKYTLKLDYTNDNSRWVYLKIDDMTCAEIKYMSDK